MLKEGLKRFNRSTPFIEGITDVLHILILLAKLVWPIVKIVNALKEFHGGGLGVEDCAIRQRLP